MKLEYSQIIIEGIDKTGKDSLRKYIDYMSKHMFAICDRGYISNIAYQKIYNRPTITYDKLNDKALYILLTAEPEDLKLRFKLTNEPAIDIEKHLSQFNETFNEMTQGLHTLKFNTSEKTLYQMAKEVINYLNELNKNKSSD